MIDVTHPIIKLLSLVNIVYFVLHERITFNNFPWEDMSYQWGYYQNLRRSAWWSLLLNGNNNWTCLCKESRLPPSPCICKGPKTPHKWACCPHVYCISYIHGQQYHRCGITHCQVPLPSHPGEFFYPQVRYSGRLSPLVELISLVHLILYIFIILLMVQISLFIYFYCWTFWSHRL